MADGALTAGFGASPCARGRHAAAPVAPLPPPSPPPPAAKQGGPVPAEDADAWRVDGVAGLDAASRETGREQGRCACVCGGERMYSLEA